MKKVLLALIAIVCVVVLTGCGAALQKVEDDIESSQYFRIHIRANSNDAKDQEVKYAVKDKVTSFLTEVISNCTTKEEVISAVNRNLTKVTNLAEEVLSSKGFDYKAKAVVKNEYFPTRAYGEYVLASDFYDALILELGEGTGDNWWCVVYPPLCFINAKTTDDGNIKYKSKLIEIINNFFGK